MGSCIELQNPGVSPLATQVDAGSSPPPPPTPGAASTQCSPVVNTGTPATPDTTRKTTTRPEAFRAEMSGVEDESALGRAGLDGRLVKEGEEWDTNEEARARATMLTGDAPHVESRPIPHNAPHTRAHSHTPGCPRCTG